MPTADGNREGGRPPDPPHPDTPPGAAHICRRPIALRRLAGSANTSTGEIATADGSTVVPCGSRFEADCPSCARTYRRRSHLLIRDGLPQDGERAVPLLLTLTAPSFGQVHRAGWPAGKPKPPRPTRCGCGTVHHPEAPATRRLLGAPVDPNTYDYAGSVAWNAAAGQLWTAQRMRLGRALDGYPVQFTRVVEPQKRGAVHFHVLAVVRPDDAGHLPTWPTVRGLVAGTLPAVGGDGSDAVQVTDPAGHTHSLGPVWDVREVKPTRDPATGAMHYGGAAAYLAKYLSKSTGGDDLADPVPYGSPLADHLDKMRATAAAWRIRGKVATEYAQADAVARLDLRHRAMGQWQGGATAQAATLAGFARPGDLARAVRGLGFIGHPRTASRGWGRSMAELRQAARVRAGLPAVAPPQPGRWEIDTAHTRFIRGLVAEGLAALPPPVLVAV